MAQKKVEFNSKPVKSDPSIEDWVTTRNIDTEQEKVEEIPSEKMKRLTIDVTPRLHRAIKMRSVEQGVTMADLVRDLLENSFPS